MNDEGPRQRPPALASTTTRSKGITLVGSQYQRVALVRIVEALQDGDVDVAYAAALGALEDEPPADDPKSRTPCPRPGCAFTGWPGQVAEHVAISHGRLPARTQPPRRIVRAAPGGRT